MFEKEAKEKADKKYPIPFNWDSIDLARNTKYEEGFRAGANFGYSKAKAKIKLLKETHQQSINILTDQIEELHKAKEWHSVKDNLPKEDCEVLIEYGNRNTHVVADWISSTKMFGAFCADEVKRWKEID